MKKISKKTGMVVLIIVLCLAILGGGITGIVMAVKTIKYSGYVVDSATGEGISGVSVTDGKNVVKTDENGKYKLSGWHKSNFVTVTIPTGYWTEKYYIRADRSVKSYDFELDKQDDDKLEHHFIQVTDSEIGSGGPGEWLEQIKEDVNETKPAFIMHTGDICYIDGLKKHIEVMNTDTMGVPVRYTIGNHDYVKYGAYGEKLFEELYGPVWYSFDVGNIHYVVTPIGHGDVYNRYSKSEAWRWLANDLKNVDEGKKVVIFNHDAAPDENGFVLEYGRKSIDLKENNLLAWIFGHWHYNMVNNINGIFNITTASPSGGGIDSSASAYRKIFINNTSLVDTTLHYIGAKEARETQEGYDWQIELGSNNLFSSPVVKNNNIYLATVSDEYIKKPVVAKLNASNGEIIWQFNPTNSVKNDITVLDDKIVFQDGEGYVYCLNETDGSVIWKKDLELLSLRNTSSSLTVENQVVYCGNSKSVFALNLEDGSTIWNNKIDKGENSPSNINVVGDLVIVGAHWNRYYAINKISGKKEWDSQKKGIYTTATPYFYDGKMLAATNNTIFELNLSNGKTIREVSYDNSLNSASTPLVDGNIAYYCTASNGIVAINLTDFSILWSYTTNNNMISTVPYVGTKGKSVESNIMMIEDSLYFGASDGLIHKVNKTTGIGESTYDIGMSILSNIAIYNDNFIVADFFGRVTSVAISLV